MLPILLVLTALLLLVGLALRELRVSLLLPMVAQVLKTRGEPERALRVLERSVSAPALLGERSRRLARYMLAWSYMAAGRYEEAAEQCRVALSRRLPATLEAEFRERLSHCLEALGRREEAAQEWERAAAILETHGAPERFRQRGYALQREGRHREACAAFSEWLKRLPQRRVEQRITAMLLLSLASSEGGDAEAGLRWAREALALAERREAKSSGERQLLCRAHVAAGIALAARRRREEAETHRRRALELAREIGNPDQEAECLAQLAGILYRQGRLLEAIRMCDEAAGMSLAARRVARSVQAEALVALGRYDAARSCLEEMRRTPRAIPVPMIERRVQGIIALGIANVEAEAGRVEAALAAIESATAVLGGEEKMSLWCAASRARILALAASGSPPQGGADAAARAAIAEVVERRSAWAADLPTAEMCAFQLARAYFALGDLDASEAEWRRLLETDPDPILLPTAWYFLGETSRLRGETAAARDAFRRALELGIDTFYARRAPERLAELGEPVDGPPSA